MGGWGINNEQGGLWGVSMGKSIIKSQSLEIEFLKDSQTKNPKNPSATQCTPKIFSGLLLNTQHDCLSKKFPAEICRVIQISSLEC